MLYVFMGNGHDCKTLGIDKISLKLHDGSSIDLFDVRYVSNLNHMLISVGALEFTGLVITLEDGTLKICLDALV